MITSSQNPKLKLVRALQGRPKEREEARAFVIEGVRLVEEAARANWPFQFALYSTGLSERGDHLLNSLSELQVDVEEVSGDLLQKLSETESHQGILAVVESTALALPASPEFIIIADQIRDPGNLGTLLRTAAAAGAQALITPPETTDAFAPKVVRAGMGAHFRLPIHAKAWAEIAAYTRGLDVYVADMHGESCWQADLRKPLALIIGSEAEGVSDEARRLATKRISIPMSGNVESLNAAVAGSVLMFEVVRQRSQS